jgi:hypothetical protein
LYVVGLYPLLRRIGQSDFQDTGLRAKLLLVVVVVVAGAAAAVAVVVVVVTAAAAVAL